MFPFIPIPSHPWILQTRVHILSEGSHLPQLACPATREEVICAAWKVGEAAVQNVCFQLPLSLRCPDLATVKQVPFKGEPALGHDKQDLLFVSPFGCSFWSIIFAWILVRAKCSQSNQDSKATFKFHAIFFPIYHSLTWWLDMITWINMLWKRQELEIKAALDVNYHTISSNWRFHPKFTGKFYEHLTFFLKEAFESPLYAPTLIWQCYNIQPPPSFLIHILKLFDFFIPTARSSTMNVFMKV